MLTKEDLQQIGTLLDEKLVKNNVVLKDAIVTEVGEVIEQNLFPKFDEMDAKIAALPSKEYIDEKIGKLGDIFVMKKKPRPSFLLPQS